MIGDSIRDNPDFVAMDPESLRELRRYRNLAGWKALLQYWSIYAEAQAEFPPSTTLSRSTPLLRRGALRAATGGGELAFPFHDSYLLPRPIRAAVRTATT